MSTPAPWSLFRLYPRTVQGISRQFLTESHERKHEYEDEERQLHAQRNRIQVYESKLPPGKNWEYYKKAVNPYEWVYTQKKYLCFPDSVCPLKPLSRSYFKMVEILELSQFFESLSPQPLRTAHVCEGPGGFIEAVYDESDKRGMRCQLSVAMTLRSRLNHVPSWRKACHFLRCHRTIQVLYGDDGTGDILKPENQQAFIDVVHPQDPLQQKVDLFTADGGFDVSDDYENQETLLFPLLVASTKIGLEVLKKGGVFVLKMFDCYHRATVDLLYFLSCHFEQWTLYKPGMSRPCNPEHYFVGKGFYGCTEEALDVMRIWCLMLEQHNPLDALFREDYTYDPAFVAWINQHRTRSYQTQVEYLDRVFQIIEQEQSGTDLTKEDLVVNERHSIEWCKRFDIPTSSLMSPVPEKQSQSQSPVPEVEE